jgi:hypothetical protein
MTSTRLTVLMLLSLLLFQGAGGRSANAQSPALWSNFRVLQEQAAARQQAAQVFSQELVQLSVPAYVQNPNGWMIALQRQSNQQLTNYLGGLAAAHAKAFQFNDWQLENVIYAMAQQVHATYMSRRPLPVQNPGVRQQAPQRQPVSYQEYLSRLSDQQLNMEIGKWSNQIFLSNGGVDGNALQMHRLAIEEQGRRGIAVQPYASPSHTTPWQDQKYKDHLSHVRHFFELQQGVNGKAR